MAIVLYGQSPIRNTSASGPQLTQKTLKDKISNAVSKAFDFVLSIPAYVTTPIKTAIKLAFMATIYTLTAALAAISLFAIALMNARWLPH